MFFLNFVFSWGRLMGTGLLLFKLPFHDTAASRVFQKEVFFGKKYPQVPANDRKFQRYGSRDFGRESRYGQRNDWLVDLISFCSFVLKYLQDKRNFSAVSQQVFSKLVDFRFRVDTEGKSPFHLLGKFWTNFVVALF